MIPLEMGDYKPLQTDRIRRKLIAVGRDESAQGLEVAVAIQSSDTPLDSPTSQDVRYPIFIEVTDGRSLANRPKVNMNFSWTLDYNL